jgi:hypothetical protein
MAFTEMLLSRRRLGQLRVSTFLVFPWGLDSMLLRVFPAIIFPIAWYHSSKPTRYITGIGAFFAGLGIMCAGAPGAVHFFGLASQAIQKLF